MINFSELLWKPEHPKGRRTAASGSSSPENPLENSYLGDIPVDEVEIKPESRIALLTDPRSPASDRFRFLRMRLREVKEAAKLQSLLITSALPQDGKTTVALNLATALAEGGKRTVLLIEADLYHPSVAQRLGLPSRPGLGECLEKDLEPLSMLRRLEPLGCYFLPAGDVRGNPTEALQSDNFAKVMTAVRPHFDWILIDTPPVAPLTDAISLIKHVDASFLVVRADHTPQEAVKGALTLLGPKNVLGIIFNAAEGLNRLYSKYYGYYAKK